MSTPRRIRDSELMLHSSHPDFRDTIEDSAPDDFDPRSDVVSRLRDFLRHRILNTPDGLRRKPRAIAARLIVLDTLLDPATTGTLASDARALGCSRGYLSNIAREFTHHTGLRVPRTNGGRGSFANSTSAKS